MTTLKLLEEKNGSVAGFFTLLERLAWAKRVGRIVFVTETAEIDGQTPGTWVCLLAANPSEN